MKSRGNERFLLSGLALLLIPISIARAQTQNLIPTDDNNVLKSASSTVQPNTSTFSLKEASTSQSNARIAFLKFDLSSFPSIADPVTFTATLNGAATANFTLQLYGLNSGTTGFNWTEDTITYGNRPAPSNAGVLVDTTLATKLGANVSVANGVAANTTASFTFNSLDAVRQSDNTATLIFLISSQDSTGPSLVFNSSEATSGQPTLTFTTPEPGTIGVLAMGIAGLLLRRRRAQASV